MRCLKVTSRTAVNPRSFKSPDNLPLIALKSRANFGCSLLIFSEAHSVPIQPASLRQSQKCLPLLKRRQPPNQMPHSKVSQKVKCRVSARSNRFPKVCKKWVSENPSGNWSRMELEFGIGDRKDHRGDYLSRDTGSSSISCRITRWAD